MNDTDETTMKNDAGKDMPVVKFLFKMNTEVVSALYNYLEEKTNTIKIRSINSQGELVKLEKAESLDEVPYEEVVPVFKIPLYDFYAVAGSFSEMQTSKECTMIEVPEKYHKEGYFACKVFGESMNRRIPNGSICIFKHPVVGSRTGKILLIECYDIQDPDMQSHFTIKTYISSKIIVEGRPRHERIILKPNSFDSSYDEIVFSEEDMRNYRLNVVGEFVGILA